MSDVTIVITRETAALTQAGFGLPLIVGTAGAVAYEECEDLAAVITAGHADGTEAYKMANAVFAQSPKPPKVAVVGFSDASALATDLNTLITTDNDWYFLLCQERGSTSITALSAWAAANNKLYFSSLDGTVAENDTLASVTLNSDRTALIYHTTPESYPDAAWVGRCAPTNPGSITWKFKTLNGITPVAISTTDIGTLHTANVNTYLRKLGVNQTSEGLTTDGTFIDIIRGQDFITARLNEGISRLLFMSPKVPYDNRGIALVLAEVDAVMKQGVANEIIALDADGNGMYTVSAPDRDEIPANDVANRHLPDVKFEFTLAGAIHTVHVSGVIKI